MIKCITGKRTGLMTVKPLSIYDSLHSETIREYLQNDMIFYSDRPGDKHIHLSTWMAAPLSAEEVGGLESFAGCIWLACLKSPRAALWENACGSSTGAWEELRWPLPAQWVPKLGARHLGPTGLLFVAGWSTKTPRRNINLLLEDFRRTWMSK